MSGLFGPTRTTEDRIAADCCETDRCADCVEPCALSRLPAGMRAVIVKILCPGREAGHLRILGLFEGTPVTIIDDRVGVVLDVRGTRVAIAASLAAAIIGLPVR